MQNFTISFPEHKGMLHIQDNTGSTVQLNPVQAMDLMDFLLRKAELIRGYIPLSTNEIEVRAWKRYLEGSAIDGISEAERLSLLEPTPFDAGVCKCGKFVEAGRLHEHQCSYADKDIIVEGDSKEYCEEF